MSVLVYSSFVCISAYVNVYGPSIRIHLQRITVDRQWWIKIRNNFVVDFIDNTCAVFAQKITTVMSHPIVQFFCWVLQHCTGLARLVWGRLRVHPSFHLFKSIWVFCVFLFSSCPFLDILHCLSRAVEVPLESALNHVSRMSPCGADDTHACCARSNDHLLYLLW